MGRRVVKLITVLFLGLLQWTTGVAQEIGTLTTSCAFDVKYTIHHPTCPEESDGSIDLELLNAVGTPCVFWVDEVGEGGNEAFVNVLKAGAYKAQIGDDSQCYDTLTFILADPLPVSFDLIADKSCPGLNSGKITVAPSSSNADKFAIDGGDAQLDPVFSDLEPGFHTVRVFDAAGCYYEETIEVEETEQPTITFAQQEVSCANDDASFIVIIESVSNSQNFEFSLDGENYLPDSTFEDLAAGLYDVYIRNENQCVFTEMIEIAPVDAPDISFDKNAVSCPGSEDASFIVIIESVSNSDDYQYSLDGINYQGETLFDNLASDFYQVYVKNSDNCVFEEGVYIEAPETPAIDIEVNDVSCPQNEDASFIVIIESVSNSQDFEFSLDGEYYQPDSTFTDLAAGIYEVHTKNVVSGCEEVNLVVVEAPEEPVINIEKNDVSCPGGSDASFIVIIESVSNSQNFEYSLDGEYYQADSSFSDLAAGVYTVYTKNAASCIQTQVIEVVEPDMPSINFEVEEVTCPGGNDASFIVIIESVSNSQDFEYSLDGEYYQPDSAFSDLAAGVYHVYSKNAVGCIYTNLMEIEEPETPTIDFEIENVTCPGADDASFIVIIESVSNSQDFVYAVDDDEFQSNAEFTNLPAGLHDVTIKNGEACLFSETIEITEPEIPTLDFDIEHVTCSGGNDASFIVIIESVSNSDFQFSIEDGVFQEDSIFTDLPAGILEVAVRDANGCISTESITIEQPLSPIIGLDINDVTCPGGTDASLIVIIESVSNSDNYEYSLDGIDFQEDASFYNLTAGIYTAYIKNQNNCIYTQLFAVEQPNDNEVSLVHTDISCPGAEDGSITVAVQGPDNVFEYSLDGISYQASNIFESLSPGAYEVMVKNANNCVSTESALITSPQVPQYETNIGYVSCNGGGDGSITVSVLSGLTPFEYALNNTSYQSENTFEDLPAGDYIVNLIDATGCEFSSAINLAEPAPMNALINGENETCDHANGWIAVAIEGGTSPYQYKWQNEATDPAISELSEGLYRVSVTDRNNCLLRDSVEIKNEPAPDIEADLQSLNCFDEANGSINLNVIGEAAPFNFVWSNGAEADQLHDLGAGEYSVTVTDQNNCLTSAHFTLEEPHAIQLTAEVTNLETSVNVDLSVVGGAAPYTYQWSDGSDAEDLNEVAFGEYEVVVTDANGCESLMTLELSDPSLPVEGAISVYPTLTSNEVNIDIQLPEALPVNIYLVDEVGRLVQVIDPSTIENQVVTMDLESLAAAVYFIRIEIGDEFIVRKVVKVIE